jgi:hypothetical protein
VLYAFGGGGSGAAMRPRGLKVWILGATSRAIGKSVNEAIVPEIKVVPHEEMATQQGIAEDPQGAGCPSLPDVGFGCAASWAAIPMLESDDAAWREWSLHGESTVPTVR